ncbi:hypothetical protein Syun_007341 [Stephania yunnanensis]|uniref:Uncharacterized protein n=1 Tax=Stephania yunnanensis TaxID=152371 RepID=A0AAP0KZC3_9MAGN
MQVHDQPLHARSWASPLHGACKMFPTIACTDPGTIGPARTIELEIGNAVEIDLGLADIITGDGDVPGEDKTGLQTYESSLSERQPELVLGALVDDSADLACTARDKVWGQLGDHWWELDTSISRGKGTLGDFI